VEFGAPYWMLGSAAYELATVNGNLERPPHTGYKSIYSCEYVSPMRNAISSHLDNR